ncbi:MAG: FHA domain-containing protein [Microscillaceae bacterium]|nr:FHA domain-containing protein [Microscillaceae bacterium]MDW8461758.1 FHA domain-containing protein [Cytophagales bacterium]
MFKVFEPIDTMGFPSLKVTIQILNKKIPAEADFKILDEDKKEVPFALNRYESPLSKGTPRNRLVFFVVETSAFTAGLPLDNIKKSLTASLDFLEEGDKVNIGYFGKPQEEEEKVLNVVSAEFTNNKNRLREAIRSKLRAETDTNLTNNDLYKGIYEAIKYMDEYKEDVAKLLIILCSTVNKTNSPIGAGNCIDKANRAGLALNIIGHRIEGGKFASERENFMLMSDKTNGLFAIAKNSSEIKNALNDFIKSTAKNDSEADKDKYVLSFNTNQPADGKSHQFEIQYAGEKQVITYVSPDRKNSGAANSFLSSYGIFILLGVGILVGFALWRYNEYRIRKREEEEAAAEAAAQAEQERLRKEVEEQARIKALEEQNIRLQEQLRAKEAEIQRAIEVSQYFQKEIKQREEEEEAKKKLRQTMIASGASTPTLHVVAGALNKQFPLNKPTITIGRNPNNDIMIPEQTVSGFHATITIENGSFILTDRNSTNGTFVNGSRIVRHLLKAGDIIKLGSASAKFEI